MTSHTTKRFRAEFNLYTRNCFLGYRADLTSPGSGPRGSKMSNHKIVPEKVTRPIQLLAAWLTGLIIVDGLFLAAAARIDAPSWASGALIITSIVNVPIFLASIFVLQTKYRPEMQEDIYYSKYLEDKTKTTRTQMPDIESQSRILAESILEQLGPDVEAQKEPIEKILHDSQIEQLIQRVGGSPTLSELYLAQGAWPIFAERWSRSGKFQKEVEDLLRDHIITTSGDDYKSCELTDLGRQVAKISQERGLLWQQNNSGYWEKMH